MIYPSKTAEQILIDLRMKAHIDKYGHEPNRAFLSEFKIKQPKTAAQLESLIVELLNRSGGCFSIISSTGRQISTKSVVKDVIGRSQVITDSKYIPGKTRKGTADILGAYKGRAIAIEVKFSKSDRQSDEQKQFALDWNDAGGLYFIAKTLNDILPIL